MEKRETPLAGFWDRPRGNLLQLLEATPVGLTSDEAKRRLRIHGPNSLVGESRFAPLIASLRFFANPLVLIRPSRAWVEKGKSTPARHRDQLAAAVERQVDECGRKAG